MPNLDRFLTAQQTAYSIALQQLKDGRKKDHWMWYIFPQIVGIPEELGLFSSDTSRFYGISSLTEATDYLEHRILGSRLFECVHILNLHNGISAKRIFGSDVMKLQSSLTLFDVIDEGHGDFSSALNKYFNNSRCDATLKILDKKALFSAKKITP